MDYIHIILILCYVDFAFSESTCVTPYGISGSCVELKDCDYLHKLLATDPSYIARSRCGANNQGVLAKSFVCCNLLPNPALRECGNHFQASASIRSRIFGGEATSKGDYPWTALLRYKYDDDVRTSCAGSLINTRYVVTAAHCINGIGLPIEWSLDEVSLGEWNISSKTNCDGDECSLPEIYGVESKKVHEKYDPESKHQLYDIALIRLNRDVNYTQWIRPICLPYTTEMIELDLNGRELELVGWGKTESQSFSPILLKTYIWGHPKTACKAIYGEQEIDINSYQLCGLSKKKGDACHGDSGGPLMLYHGALYYLSGVVSFGPIPCGSPNFPGVYTRVSSFMYWIQNNIEP